VQIILLGTIGWVPTELRETACVYLREGDRVLLLDAGTGVRRLLTSPDLLHGVGRIDVCLTHFHLDHVIGLSYLPSLPAEIEKAAWGPGAPLYDASTADVLARMIGPPLFALELAQVVSSVGELPLGEIDLGPFRVGVRRQDRHTQPSVALRVGDELAYCTDTGYDPPNALFSKGCRELLHEAFYLDHAPDDTHATPAEAARIARDADVSGLTLMHLDPRLEPREAESLEQAKTIFPDTKVGSDLVTLI
jgi:ribonuclease BN (tRNA processing enzyme)